ncbi:DUF2064 domain-containing protein [Adlercreutzia sp. ZJ154]|uniref:TIGR04282 family arsenosugar biosynthesis glycosyltransferase n=1 Tax=Adlercreutzia sp. ZJ154 TaxID=2709790 RepID=UPI0013EBB9EC|nr:DUF2064 domain-containing protein [Adlercreutzia sp. ZJ154]
MRKNVLLLFSKLPEAGLVKTRLTTLKDGIFEPEVASALYHCMLFDVCEICMAAFDKLEAKNTDNAADEYELVISTAPAENVERMQKLFSDAGRWPRPITFIADEGASFDEHYNDAFQKCWDMKADCILSMGADMPALTTNDVIAGFKALHKLEDVPRGGIVLAPDQEMGVSIIGWTRETAFNHSGVFYNKDGLTVLPAYIQKAREAELPAIYLPPVPDVDTMADLMHNITLVEALNYCAAFDGNTPPWRTANALREMGWDEVRVPPNTLHDPREHIDK